MYNLDKKKRIIVGVIAVIIICLACYYVYAKDEEKNTEIENNLEVENFTDKNNQSEDSSEREEEYILVHVSGAVNKEGVVKLKMDSRMSDAIEAARWIKGRCKY